MGDRPLGAYPARTVTHEGTTGTMAERAVQVDGYEHLQLIGEGGFSRVYRARQVAFDRDVALKVLDVGLDERQRRAFERECRAMGVVSQHPHIVTVYSATYTTDGRPCIVMELYGGGTYADRVRREGALPPADVLQVGVRICGALQTAHDRGLLHRDVKPQNLFLSDYGEPALGDFGISSFDDDASRGAAGLSVHYAAPEVIEHQRTSPLSDVYSLGAALYTLLAGRRPFAIPGQKQRVADVALRVLREDPPRIGGAVPPGLEDAVRSAMARQADDRPSSAAALGRRLQELQEELGQTRTPLAVAASDPAPAADAYAVSADHRVDDDGETMTVARAAADSRAPVEEPPPPSRTRVLVSTGAGLVVVAGLVVAGVLAVRGGDEATPSPTTAPTEVAATDAVLPPPVPRDVTLERIPDGLRVTWDGVSDDVTWQVRRVDEGYGDRPPVQVEGDPVAVLRGVDEDARPCVQVRAVNAAGQTSRPSEVVCA